MSVTPPSSPPPSSPPPTDAAHEGEARTGEQRAVVLLLRGGLVVSVLLFVVGSIVGLGGSPEAPAVTFDTFAHARFSGSTIAGAGVLVLATTPLVRVLSLFVLWMKERDYRYAAVAAFVALVLLGAIFAGRGG